MTLFVEIVYIFVTVVLILVVLLQAGRGGGLGTALGGGASQGVFGGGGGADFLAKLTQGLAAGFMVCAVYLAYASAHTESDRLVNASVDTKQDLVDDDEEVDYERIGEGTPLVLPEAGAAAEAPQTPAAIEEVPEPPALQDGFDEAPSDGEPAADPAAQPANDTPAQPADEATPPATDAEAPTAEPEPVAAEQ